MTSNWCVNGPNPEELAKEFEPSAQTIRNWVARADRDEGRRYDGVTSTKREELGRLRQRLPGYHRHAHAALSLRR